VRKLYPRRVRRVLSLLPGRSRLWWICAFAGGIAVLAVASLPVDSLQRSLVARGAGLLSVGLFCVACRRLPPEVRAVWRWVGASLVITVLADLVFDFQVLVQHERPFPGVADPLYLAACGCAVMALITLARRMSPGVDLASWIDISIMVLAASAFIAAFVLGSAWPWSGFGVGAVLDVVYPLLSLVLVIAILRLVILPAPPNAAIRTLAVAGSLFLLCDLIFSNQLLEGRTHVVALETLWTAAVLCIPLAALSPGATHFAAVEPHRSDEVTTTRQVLLCISAIAVPSAVIIELTITGTLVASWLLFVIVALVALVLVRLQLLLRAAQRTSAEQAHRAQFDALTGLLTRPSWDRDLDELVSRARDHGGVLAFAMLDIDHFEDQRRERGQRIADLLLVSVTIAWLGELDEGDVLARYGGDEFTLLLCRNSLGEAQEVLRRLQRATPEGLGICVGAALLRPDEDPRQAVLRAERAMQAMRTQGIEAMGLDQAISS